MANTYKIVVLNDGSTYSGVDGAAILVISEADHDALANDEIDVDDIKPIARIELSEGHDG